MKPAQKLKGARLEAGQTQERDDASLLAHREESKDAVKSRRAFLRFVLVTVYLVVWGVSVLAFWMGGRTDAMGYSLVVFYAVLPLSTLVLSFFIGCGRAWDGCKRTMLFFFGAMSMLGPYVTFSLSNMASFQKFNLPELSAFLPGLLCAVAGMAGLASHSMAAPGLFTSVQFFDPANPMSIVWVFAVMALAVVLSFILTLLLGFEDIPVEEATAEARKHQSVQPTVAKEVSLN